MPDLAVTIYVARMTVMVVFALACFWRAWENHVDHERLRWSLVMLGLVMLSEAAVLLFRIDARMHTAAMSRIILDGPLFYTVEIAATVLLIALFFVLQKPRKGP